MDKLNIVEIKVCGNIDFTAADRLTARIRAAMCNEVNEIILKFDESVSISSAEFLAFLSTSSAYMNAKGSRLSIKGANSKSQVLIRISQLEHLLE